MKGEMNEVNVDGMKISVKALVEIMFFGHIFQWLLFLAYILINEGIL